MPQGSIAVADANLIPQGAKSVKNITAATVLKATPGTLLGFTVVQVATGSGAAGGTVNDCATTGAVAASNEVAVLGNSAVSTTITNIPCSTGIVVTPGTGGTQNQIIAAWYI